MQTRFFRATALSLFVCSALASVTAASAAPAASPETQKSGFMQYFNPMRKDGYVNSAQDRAIKKKKFVQLGNAASCHVANPELGLFAIVPPDKLSDSTWLDNELSKDEISGVTVYFPWSTLQPSEDNCNWKPIDAVLDACGRHQKTAILYVTTAGGDKCDTPDWVLSAGVKSVTYKTADGAAHVMPIFWDKNYLAKWSNFVSEFGERYDGNPNIHSVGITGGGILGGTEVVPPSAKVDGADPAAVLKQQYGMNERQLVEHWKYVANLFPKNFKHTHLNFEVNPPLPGKMGEECLDEIGDYLVYRFGERVYLTRSGFKTARHEFNDLRMILKFQNDTLTGVRLQPDLHVADMDKIAQHALDDGISFVEVPAALFDSQDATVKSALEKLACNVGYRIICNKVSVPEKLNAGQALKASFDFVNTGAAPALRPERNLEKDSAASYRVAVEVRDAQGKPVLLNLHTPPVPTSQWKAGKPISWDKQLRMVDGEKHQLAPGEYSIWISLVDADGKRKVSFLAPGNDGKLATVNAQKVGMLTVTDEVAQTDKPKGDNASSNK